MKKMKKPAAKYRGVFSRIVYACNAAKMKRL